MDLPIIIVEFGQQRQRFKLNKFYFTVQELIELFSQIFHISFNLQNYDILLLNKSLNSIINLDFTQLDNYSRFKIQLKTSDEMNLLKQRLNIASMEIKEVTLLINSIHKNCKDLIEIFNDENHLIVPPGFKSISQRDSEDIDHDTGNVSIFESAHSDYESESIYVECREDLTIVNDKTQLEWRNQPYRSQSHWNSNKVKYQSNYSKNQFNDKPRLKKSMNLNKAPLPPEKKKNIPCKYAAGGNCKRGKIFTMKLNLQILFLFNLGSQCRFIHVV